MVGVGSLGGTKRIDECQDARERLRVPLWYSEMSKGAGTSRFWEGKGLKDLDLGKGGGGSGGCLGGGRRTQASPPSGLLEPDGRLCSPCERRGSGTLR